MANNKLPSVRMLKSLFVYDTKSRSCLTRRVSIRGGRGVGSEVGWADKDGYWIVGINYTKYRVHRIVFKMFHGKEPVTVDHIDGNTANNKIENLRAATYRENQLNRKVNKNNTSGYPGVGWHKHHKKWRVYARYAGGRLSLGMFALKRDAIAASKAFMQTHDTTWRRDKKTSRRSTK